jgi:hypothetical protein
MERRTPRSVRSSRVVVNRGSRRGSKHGSSARRWKKWTTAGERASRAGAVFGRPAADCAGAVTEPGFARMAIGVRDADPPHQHPRDQHVREPGAQHRPGDLRRSGARTAMPVPDCLDRRCDNRRRDVPGASRAGSSSHPSANDASRAVTTATGRYSSGQGASR